MKLKGVSAGTGEAIGPAFIYNPGALSYEIYPICDEDIQREILRFEEAVSSSRKQLKELKKKARKFLDRDSAQVFDTHVMMLDDPLFVTEVFHLLKEKQVNIECVVDEVVNKLVNMFSSMQDTTLQDRAMDIRDVGHRILRNLEGSEELPAVKLEKPSILVAASLTPSQLVALERDKILGIVTEEGGKTSHVAIFAHTMNKPIVVGVKDVLKKIEDGKLIIVDADRGEVFLKPGSRQIKTYEAMHNAALEKARWVENFRDCDAKTLDGKTLVLRANMDLTEELELIQHSGATGIGLFRTEYMFMHKDFIPSEEEQYQNYRHIASFFKEDMVYMRTLDVGGDKKIRHIHWPREDNPTLGWRGIRVLLELEEIFRNQLRAILRSSTGRNVCIVLPMITSVEEVRRARKILEDVKESLVADNLPFDESIQMGIMIETPAAIAMADCLAAEVDFFSIGTNDLIQFYLAVDRMNNKIANLYDACNPAILRSLKRIVDIGRDTGRNVSVCGEMASDPLGVLALVGLGVDTLSVNPVALCGIKSVIRHMSAGNAVRIVDKILEMPTSDDVRSVLMAELRRIRAREEVDRTG